MNSGELFEACFLAFWVGAAFLAYVWRATIIPAPRQPPAKEQDGV